MDNLRETLAMYDALQTSQVSDTKQLKSIERKKGRVILAIKLLQPWVQHLPALFPLLTDNT